ERLGRLRFHDLVAGERPAAPLAAHAVELDGVGVLADHRAVARLLLQDLLGHEEAVLRPAVVLARHEDERLVVVRLAGGPRTAPRVASLASVAVSRRNARERISPRPTQTSTAAPPVVWRSMRSSCSSFAASLRSFNCSSTATCSSTRKFAATPCAGTMRPRWNSRITAW